MQSSNVLPDQSTLALHHPGVKIARLRERVSRLQENQQTAIRRRLTLASHQLSLQVRSLDTLNPTRILQRGFATVSKDEKLVTSVRQLSSGDDIDIRLADGSKAAKVT